jgi:hypothetical protein
MFMKTIIAAILILALYDVSAFEIQVKRMNRTPGYTERFDLNTTLDEKVVLDCQSFIQGLLFGPMGEGVIMLQEWECDELMGDMKKSMNRMKKHCLEVDRDRAVMDSQHTCT